MGNLTSSVEIHGRRVENALTQTLCGGVSPFGKKIHESESDVSRTETAARTVFRHEKTSREFKFLSFKSVEIVQD